MTCAIALTAALFFTADPAVSMPKASEAVSAAILVSDLSAEPDFAALVQEAQRLKGTVDGWMIPAIVSDIDFLNSSPYITFKADAQALATADMNGHLELKRRGTDGDLTCILRGIAEDMPKKIEQLEGANPGEARLLALQELAYLLNDNAEVILAPPAQP